MADKKYITAKECNQLYVNQFKNSIINVEVDGYNENNRLETLSDFVYEGGCGDLDQVMTKNDIKKYYPILKVYDNNESNRFAIADNVGVNGAFRINRIAAGHWENNKLCNIRLEVGGFPNGGNFGEFYVDGDYSEDYRMLSFTVSVTGDRDYVGDNYYHATTEIWVSASDMMEGQIYFSVNCNYFSFEPNEKLDDKQFKYYTISIESNTVVDNDGNEFPVIGQKSIRVHMSRYNTESFQPIKLTNCVVKIPKSLDFDDTYAPPSKSDMYTNISTRYVNGKALSIYKSGTEYYGRTEETNSVVKYKLNGTAYVPVNKDGSGKYVWNSKVTCIWETPYLAKSQDVTINYTNYDNTKSNEIGSEVVFDFTNNKGTNKSYSVSITASFTGNYTKYQFSYSKPEGGSTILSTINGNIGSGHSIPGTTISGVKPYYYILKLEGPDGTITHKSYSYKFVGNTIKINFIF